MQVVGDFNDWKAIGKGDQYDLPGSRVRAVTLEVNSAAAVAAYVVYHDDGSVNFLARVCGRDKVRFIARGKTSIVMEPVDGGTLYIYTRDGDVIHIQPTVKDAFTKYHERQPFDPKYEAMLALVRENARRVDQAVAEAKQAKEALNAERARANQERAAEPAAAPAAAPAGSDGGRGHAEAEQSPAVTEG